MTEEQMNAAKIAGVVALIVIAVALFGWLMGWWG
jgi:hypothetical protein